MPWGLKRFQESRQLHFVTFSCYRRRPLLDTPARRELFERALEATRRSYRLFVARRLALHSAEPFWQARYYDFNVWSERKRMEKLKYMHLNPVKRGLVARPEDWPWSSFRHYATGCEGLVEIESQWTARRRERLGVTPKAVITDTNPHPSKTGSGGAPSRVRAPGSARPEFSLTEAIEQS
jgi:putative transposase